MLVLLLTLREVLQKRQASLEKVQTAKILKKCPPLL